jgi:tetratricopeptide (TPR) repeat protein
LNNLGNAYKKLDRAPEVEGLLRRALSIREKALLPKNPLIAQSLQNLATVLEEQGRNKEAEPLRGSALSIQRLWLWHAGRAVFSQSRAV